MAAVLSKRVVFVMLALIAGYYWLIPVQGDTLTTSSGVELSCPEGWVVQSFRGAGPGYSCYPDPCFPNPCGSGNTCNVIEGFAGPAPNCTCSSPYLTGDVPIFGFDESHVCYLPGQDVCNPNPCQNGGTCSYATSAYPPGSVPLTDNEGTKYAFTCDCSNTVNSPVGPQRGPTCNQGYLPAPSVTATLNGVTGPLAAAVLDFNLCGDLPPVPCLFADGAHFICCEGGTECGPIGPDGNTPICPGASFIPTPNNYPAAETPTPPPVPTPASPPGEDPVFGVCGHDGDAKNYPTRCYFNNDPQGRYVCCDNQGCDGFNSDNLTPHCTNNGYVPPNYGLSGPGSPPGTPPSSPPTGDQGVCGTGDAAIFTTRCWFNNDPQGRYVCCDNQGCNGFNADNLTPHCANFGYVPPNFGLSGGPSPPSTPPSTPPSGDEGVCGSGDASFFPTRCWFNSDPLRRYVCCDSEGCDGFNDDNLTPHCARYGYVPPGYGRI